MRTSVVRVRLGPVTNQCLDRYSIQCLDVFGNYLVHLSQLFHPATSAVSRVCVGPDHALLQIVCGDPKKRGWNPRIQFRGPVPCGVWFRPEIEREPDHSLSRYDGRLDPFAMVLDLHALCQGIRQHAFSTREAFTTLGNNVSRVEILGDLNEPIHHERISALVAGLVHETEFSLDVFRYLQTSNDLPCIVLPPCVRQLTLSGSISPESLASSCLEHLVLRGDETHAYELIHNLRPRKVTFDQSSHYLSYGEYVCETVEHLVTRSCVKPNMVIAFPNLIRLETDYVQANPSAVWTKLRHVTLRSTECKSIRESVLSLRGIPSLVVVGASEHLSLFSEPQ